MSDDKEYRFIITKVSAGHMKGEVENELRLVATISSVSANRTILTGINSFNNENQG